MLLLLGRQYWKSGQTALADRHVTEAIALLENLPDARDLAMAYSARSQRAMTSDHTGEALEFGQRALDLAVQFGDNSVRAHALNNIGGDPGVDPLLEEATRLALPTGELQRIGRVAAARAEVAWYRGDPKRVVEEAGIGLKAAVGHRDAWTQGELAFWARRADPALEVPSGVAEPYALMIEGDWEGAAAAWREINMPYERALALADGPEEALRESLEMLEHLGAGPLAAIVRQRLRGLGVRGIPRGPRASTRENPAGLTAREVQVLTLLVRGHTNNELAQRLHVSAKTIDHHVSSILEKLEVRSRTEAVTAAFELGIATAAD